VAAGTAHWKQGRLIAGVIRASLDRLSLTPEQNAITGTVVAEELRRVVQREDSLATTVLIVGRVIGRRNRWNSR